MIKRIRYLDEIRPFYDSDLIKIITGIRRCGKSVLLRDICNEIKETTENIIFIDFEDITNITKIPDVDKLLNYVEEHKKKGLCYVFLDEVQKLPNWADACRTLRVRDCSVFISGSNSKLLSREFTKELSGRYVSFRVRPFVYIEIQEYAKELNKKISIIDYIVWGGFPKMLEFNDEVSKKKYLSDLNDTIIMNDLMNRYNIRKKDIFRNIVNYIFISNSRIFSARSILNYMKSTRIDVSLSTITKFISYLQEAYAIQTVKLYSPKAKRELNYYQKIYNEDVSFNSIRAQDNLFDLTHNFENLVLNELYYKGYSIYTYNDGKHEIDFVATKDNKKYYIQAALSIADKNTYLREFALFNKLDNTNQKIIITNDELDYSTSTVRHIKFKDFLLMKEL